MAKEDPKPTPPKNPPSKPKEPINENNSKLPTYQNPPPPPPKKSK